MRSKTHQTRAPHSHYASRYQYRPLPSDNVGVMMCHSRFHWHDNISASTKNAEVDVFAQKRQKDRGVMSTLKKTAKLDVHSYVGCHRKMLTRYWSIYPAAQMKKRTLAAAGPQKNNQSLIYVLLSDTGGE